MSPQKQIITNFYQLQIDNVNAADLMKTVNISCESLDNFVTFYQTLHYHFKNYNIMIREAESISEDNFRELSGIAHDAKK